MADPITEAGAPPSASCGSYFHGGRGEGVILTFQGNGWEETQESPFLWGLQSEHLGAMMVSNGIGSKIPKEQKCLIWVPPMKEALLLRRTKIPHSEPPIHSKPCPRPSAHAI